MNPFRRICSVPNALDRWAGVISMVALLTGLTAAPAWATDPGPSISISAVTIEPLPLGDPNDASRDIVQTITWSNLPPDVELWYYTPTTGGIVRQDAPDDWVCGGGGNGYPGQCARPPTSGTWHWTYRPSLLNDQYANCACLYRPQVQMWMPEYSDSQRWYGTVTISGTADVTLQVDSSVSWPTISVRLGNNGPTHAPPSTLTITGFAAPITASAGCTASGLTVTCTVPKILAGKTTSSLFTVSGVAQPTRLTLRLTGYFPDPDPSSNTAIAFPDAPGAAPPPTAAAPVTTTSTGSRAVPGTPTTPPQPTAGPSAVPGTTTPSVSGAPSSGTPLDATPVVATVPASSSGLGWLTVGGIILVALLVAGGATTLILRRRPGVAVNTSDHMEDGASDQ